MSPVDVLSWGSSFTTTSSTALQSSSRRRGAENRTSWPGPPEELGIRSAAVVVVVSRSSNNYSHGDSPRLNAYGNNNSSNRSSSSTNSRGANVVSIRPRRPRDDDNNESNGQGGRWRWEGRREGGREARDGGGRGGRRDREKQLHPGAYRMRDEQTGEDVIVWGVEDDDDVPMPTKADLNWRKMTVAIPGDASDQTWKKVVEQQSGASGSYRVKGVEPDRRRGRTDNFYEGDNYDDEDDDDDKLLDDEDDDESLDDEDEGGSESEATMAGPRVAAVSRAPRVKVFGRDLWGKAQLRVKTTDNEKLRRDAAENDDRAGQGRRGDSEMHNESGEKRVASSLDSQSTLESRNSNIDASRSLRKSRDTAIERKSEKKSLPTIKLIDQVVKETTLSRGRSLREAATDDDDGDGKIRKEEGRSSKSSNCFNPSIVDISEDHDTRSRFKQQDDLKKTSGLLDRLRSQVADQPQRLPKSTRIVGSEGAPDPAAETASATTRLEAEDDARVASPSKVAGGDLVGGDPVRPPMRNLTARDNYDASIANNFFSMKSFKDIGASPDLMRALAHLHVNRPSEIQVMAFKPILEGKSCIVAEQAGSGKTLAYIGPLVQRLKAEEEEAQTSGQVLTKKPRVLVLVPTGELAAQVLRNFRSLSQGGLPCRSVVITGGFKWKTQVESLQGGADVVVATPGRLLQQLQAGNLQLDHLQSVVLDEVDILFDDEEFAQALQTINTTASIKVQYIHVTATLPVDIHDDLLERYPDCLSLMGPSLHRTAVGLQEILVDCSGGEADEKTPESAFVNKRRALLQLVEERPVAKTIIFCNKLETCRKVENVLSRYDRSGQKISVLPYHAALTQETRIENLKTFSKPRSKTRLFLVCTDRASRGIDSLDVEHVVLFDFPRDPSEYVRRVGRTARGAGGTGRVFAFVVGRQVSYARRVMARNDKGEPVHDVPGSRYYYTN